jgi:hypothetical protein
VLFRMAATNDAFHVGDDMDTLTVMNEDVVMRTYSPSDTRYQRDVSGVPKVVREEI